MFKKVSSVFKDFLKFVKISMLFCFKLKILYYSFENDIFHKHFNFRKWLFKYFRLLKKKELNVIIVV